jgi:sugar-phosphatase
MPAAKPVAGATQLLLRLHHQKIPIGVVTSGPRDYAQEQLRAIGALHLLNVLVTSNDVNKGKPDPEGYLSACATLEVNPEQTIVFEDAPAGVHAAKRAGAFCIGLTTTQPAEALAAADLTISDFTNIPWPIISLLS